MITCPQRAVQEVEATIYEKMIETAKLYQEMAIDYFSRLVQSDPILAYGLRDLYQNQAARIFKFAEDFYQGRI